MRRPALLLSTVLVLAAIGRAPSTFAGELSADRQALYAEYTAKLDQLATACEKQQEPAAAERLRAWLPKREPDQLTLFVLDSADEPADSDPKSGPDWRGKWQSLRDEQADRLYDLARRAAAEHQPSLAYELVVETVRENPDHKQARRWLGYVRFRDAWHTPFEARQLGAGKVWHDEFGWLPKSHVERYERGQRYYQGRWLAANDETALRRDVKRGWRVETDHYVVTTNHSLAEGVRLARMLERLYAVWQQVFVSFVLDDAELVRRFEGKPGRGETRQHNVVYFRSRDEYNDALRALQPKIDITLGIYLDGARTAYFFAGDEQDAGTLYHEATHQLFQETRTAAADVGRRDNFWIVEGIACYMESLTHTSDHYTLGGMNAGRMPAARHRLLTDDFYVPLAELVQMGLESLQRDPRIARLYSQSSGLADFLMHAQGGRYREAVVSYLSAIYSGRATPRTLSDLTRVSYAELDRQYREYMTAGAATSEVTSEATR